MKYYIKLYFTYLKRAIISRLSYKKDALIGIFSFFLTNIASFLSLYFIIRSIPSLNGWDIYSLGFLMGFSMMPIALDHALTDELWQVAYFLVRNGQMDRFFTKPLPVLFQIIAELFQPEAFGELFLGIAMMIICGIKIKIKLTFSTILLMMVATIFGALIITSIKIAASSLAFKMKRSGIILQVQYELKNCGIYPISIYPKILKGILCFVVPFGLIMSIPVETAIYQTYNPYFLCGWIILTAICFLTVSILIWNAMIHQYESSGS